MSGGVDSSVVATLAKEAFPNNSLGVFLIIKNMNKDLEDAKAVAKKINIKTIEINLTSAYKEIKKYINKKSKLAKANIKPRLRMTMLYALAQEKKYLVLGTDNLAE
jgi:NAD+ synthase